MLLVMLFRLLFVSQPAQTRPDNPKPTTCDIDDAGMPMCPKVIQ